MSKLQHTVSKIVFVTVGTTQFNELVHQVLHPDILEVLEADGYTHLIMQIGSGVQPQIPSSQRIQITWYRLKENISADIESASLIVSHAGAGSCLEALGAKKALVVVVNQSLMGNHQLELASKLHQEGYAIMCYPETLNTTLSDLQTKKMKRLPKVSPVAFSSFIENLMGL